MNRPADPVRGKLVYADQCQSCHQADGQGLVAKGQREYTYPPLWGSLSYNDGAGLYRLSNFAGYVKYNMPNGATHDAPMLSDEDSWDVAAYVNSQPRPKMNIAKDWPDASRSPLITPSAPLPTDSLPSSTNTAPLAP